MRTRPPEIRDVLDWYGDEDAKEDISDFVGKFLGALYEDGAVVLDTLQVSAPETDVAAD